MNSEIHKCPYCDNALLRHARHTGVYWFCTSCWQEVPSFSNMVLRGDRGLSSLEVGAGSSTAYRHQ